MIGPILNLLRNTYSSAEIIQRQNYSSFLPENNVFGNGTQNVTITKDTTAEELFNKYKTLEFKNLTINTGIRLTPSPEYYHEWDGIKLYSQYTKFHPLFLKCSGTLKVLGALTSQGMGANSTNASHTGYSFVQKPFISPIDLTCAKIYEKDPAYTFSKKYGPHYSVKDIYGFDPHGNKTYSYSANTTDFFRLLEYGRNFGFLNGNGIFLVGGGGSYHYEWNRHGKTRRRDINSYSFSNGGMGGDEDRNGCGGGFLALYFRKLYIDGKEYGKEPCDISKISANGYLVPYQWTRGGGCMVIAADTIIIGPNGTINSDADGAVWDKTIHNSMGTIYKMNREWEIVEKYRVGWFDWKYRTIKGDNKIKPSFMNNLPALFKTQEGTIATAYGYSQNSYSTGVYYFDDGTGLGMPNCYMEYDYDNRRCGGAGVALGYQIQ